MDDTIFLAYAFRFQAVREAVKIAADGIADVRCADDRLTGLHLLEKIQEMMQEAKLCLFDLTGHNVNVAVEYGLARGLSLSPLILYNDDERHRPIENVPDVFSDLRGLDSLRYRSFDDLPNLLRPKLPDLLKRSRKGRPIEGRPRLQMVLTGKSTPSDYAFYIGNVSNVGTAVANRVSCSLAGYIDPTGHSGRVLRIGTVVPNEPPREVRLRYDDTGMMRQATGFEHVLVEYMDDDGQRYEQRGKFIAYIGDETVRSYSFDGLGPAKRIDRFSLHQFGLEEP